MDLSALIFVALAVAWAVYLVPKALKHHEDSAASRSIDGFSDRLRVLARREPVDRKTARLVVEGEKPAAVPAPVVREPMTPQQARAHRAASMAAARRRRKVVSTILVAIIVTLAVATAGVSLHGLRSHSDGRARCVAGPVPRDGAPRGRGVRACSSAHER